MKKMRKLAGIAIVSFAVVMALQVPTTNAGTGQDVLKQQKPGHGFSTGVTSRRAKISGLNDIRLITPLMNYRERVEMQRALKKRAAAQRNALLHAAAVSRAKALKNTSTN